MQANFFLWCITHVASFRNSGKVTKFCKLFMKVQLHRVDRPVAVFGDYDLRNAGDAALFPMEDEHHIGVLLDLPAVPEVGQLRACVITTLATLNVAVHLAEHQEVALQFLGQTLKVAGDFGDLLGPVALVSVTGP